MLSTHSSVVAYPNWACPGTAVILVIPDLGSGGETCGVAVPHHVEVIRGVNCNRGSHLMIEVHASVGRYSRLVCPGAAVIRALLDIDLPSSCLRSAINTIEGAIAQAN
ncbi:hypothetical protein ES703_76755 [subsurface metagenome]